MQVKNKKIIRQLSFRTLWASRKRNLIAIIAIALTTLLFTSLATVTMSINSSYQTYTFRQIGGYAHGTFKDVTKEQEAAISSHAKVKATGERQVIGFIYDGIFAKVPAEVSYMDENCTEWSWATPTAGHLPRSEKEITMDTGSLKLLGIAPELGAEISLTYSVGDKEQAAYEKTDTFILAGYWEYDDISPVHYINISKEYAEKVEAEAVAAGLNPFRRDLNVMMASSVNIRGQMEQVDRDLGYDWETEGQDNTVRIGVNWGYTTEQMSHSMDPQMMLAIAAFLVLVVFTGYLIIYNIFQISVAGDIRFYGLLKTIGVTPRQTRRIIRWQAIFLCVVGIPIGLLIGYGVGAVLTPVVMSSTMFGAGVSTISTSPLIFVVSAAFSLVTVLLSCFRPGRIAGKVSPVEATKYTEAMDSKKKRRTTRGAKVHQMAFANLGRNRSKTVLVVISLALSVVLLNVLITFVSGFDMEKYLEQQTCADFIVSSTDYFRYVTGKEEYISGDEIEAIRENTSRTMDGCGYTLRGQEPMAWMTEKAWKMEAGSYISAEELDGAVKQQPHKNDLVGESMILEGLDESLFDKLTVIEGDIAPLYDTEEHAIALAANTDDYGALAHPEYYPAIGDKLTVTYVEEAYFIDSRTGEKSDENTPEEYLEYHIAKGHDVDYTVCAYVDVPYSMSCRYTNNGYSAVLPVQTMQKDSGQEVIPLLWVFDTPDAEAEAAAESFLADMTVGEQSKLMYESKATLREGFESFRDMFLLLGGLLCAIIGLVGVLNFFNAIVTGILSRKREFAVLQAVGMTNRQLKTMLIYEGLFYALGAAVIALVFSVILSPLAARILGTMFWFFSPHFTLVPVLAAIPVFALLGFLIPYVMYGQTARQSVVERLREA